jgi:hypothetical protein
VSIYKLICVIIVSFCSVVICILILELILFQDKKFAPPRDRL